MAVINGNDGANNLIGTLAADIIKGFGSNDSIQGRSGNDQIFGGEGDDTIEGGRGHDELYGDRFTYKNPPSSDSLVAVPPTFNDKIFGGKGNDKIWGERGNDRLFGEDGNDRLEGGDGNDRLNGGDGSDRLYGGTQNDVLIGGAGNDVLVGADFSTTTPGQGEKDILIGGTGKDKFILGSISKVAYDDGILGNAGTNDYALIRGFVVGNDTIQLKGSETYSLSNTVVNGVSGTAIFHIDPTGPARELVGLVAGVNFNALTVNNGAQLTTIS